MDAPHAREFHGLFDPAHRAARPGRFLHQHVDIHPLLARPIGQVAQNAILKHFARFFIRRSW